MRQSLLLVIAVLAGSAPGWAGGDPSISIQPGVVAQLGPSQVVPPRLPYDPGGDLLEVSIHTIERVALVTADNLPRLHSALPRGDSREQVWAVFFRGRIRAVRGLGYITEPQSVVQGYYLVSDETGAWLRVGALGTGPAQECAEGSRGRCR